MRTNEGTGAESPERGRVAAGDAVSAWTASLSAIHGKVRELCAAIEAAHEAAPTLATHDATVELHESARRLFSRLRVLKGMPERETEGSAGGGR